jgi:uncharacterized surface protein with fasciclin (FAS1) repeats
MKNLLPLGAAAVLMLSACSGGESGENATATGQTGNAAAAAGNKTIAAGLDQNSRFFQAAKSAGLDSTLAGPGPYTVLVPDDAAFGKIPPEVSQRMQQPESRAELTGLLTHHVLIGTVLAEDIGKAIDNGKGKTVLATVGGGTVTATREGGNIVLSDAAGNKATITKADETYTNGVIHRINAVLTPADGTAAGGAQQPAG